MNGIKMSDCRFYVNEEERTVVCVIPKTKYMLEDFAKDHFKWNDFDFDFGIGYDYMKSLYLPSSFMGKAVCAPEDEWNEETGRMIAFSRAKDKCYKSFFKRANKLVQMVDRRLGDMITLFNDFGMKLDDKREALQTKINGRIGTTEAE